MGNSQHSEHYKKEIQTIDFMRISKGEQAVKDFALLTTFKYWDRLGKKDDHDKDAYKMLDYACYYVFGKWFHEMKDVEKTPNKENEVITPMHYPPHIMVSGK